MSNLNKNDSLEDIWSRYVDLDEQVMMQELHLEQLNRGRTFS